VNIKALLEECTVMHSNKKCFVARLSGDALEFWKALNEYRQAGHEVVGTRVKEKMQGMGVAVSLDVIRIHLRDECAGCKARAAEGVEPWTQES